MRTAFQTYYGFKQSNRKWRIYENEKPIELPKDAPQHKIISLQYERHTLVCDRCSMFALKRLHSMAEMCKNGARIAARYYKAKKRWMHENPLDFARTVVGGVLFGQRVQKWKRNRATVNLELDHSESGPSDIKLSKGEKCVVGTTILNSKRHEDAAAAKRWHKKKFGY